MERFHGLLTLGGTLFPLHVQSEALLQVGFGPDTVDALLRLAEAAVGSLDRVAGRGQQFVVQELQRLLQVRTLQLVQALAQGVRITAYQNSDLSSRPAMTEGLSQPHWQA